MSADDPISDAEWLAMKQDARRVFNFETAPRGGRTLTGYRVRVECSDCTYEGDMGCGGGFPWHLGGESNIFATEADANAAIDAVDGAGPWTYTIVPVHETLLLAAS